MNDRLFTDTSPGVCKSIEEAAARAVAAYSDGGLIGPDNPSLVGGVYAWCWTDRKGIRLWSGYGLIKTGAQGVSSDIAELVGAVHALAGLPDGWAGQLCLDSWWTLARLRWHAPMQGIPSDLVMRARAQVHRLGDFEPVLLHGHPTDLELAWGRSEGGRAVSEHNVFCDELCARMKHEYFAGYSTGYEIEELAA